MCSRLREINAFQFIDRFHEKIDWNQMQEQHQKQLNKLNDNYVDPVCTEAGVSEMC